MTLVGRRLLSGVRVLELASDIAGPYCGKLFRDTDADVVKVEAGDGDPLRRWSAADRADPASAGVLFSYLNAGKRSVDARRLDELIRVADVAIVDDAAGDDQIEQWRAASPALTIVSVTPFGRSGPWTGRPWTEFVLQAIGGSIGVRGEPGRQPLQAGGRLGEFVTGAFAAVAGLAGLMGSRTRGAGQFADVSMLECVCITMGGFGALQESLGRPPMMPARFVEMPSVEVAADGYVGFCTVTRQQFQDFAVMIGRPEYLDDEELATYSGRQRRRHEFQSTVRAWTQEHTVDEIIELASLFRIPVTRVGTPETVTTFDQFVERKVFVPGPDGSYLQPRRPFLIDGESSGPDGAAPDAGADTDRVQWAARPAAPRPAGEVAHPLAGITVVDLTAFWAGPTATQLLAALGADVIKVESVQRPDGMRFSSSRPASEPFWWEFGAHYQTANTNKRGITLDLGSSAGRELLFELLRRADVLIENFSPRVLENFGITWDAVHAHAPSVVMVRMPAFGLSGPWRDRTGFAQTMEQVTGLAWMTGYRDGVPIIPKGICDPNAGVHAAFAVLAGLADRDSSGQGCLVECPMVEAALNIAAEPILEYTAHGIRLRRDGNRGPVAAPQGVYACQGTEQWLALAVATDAQWNSLREILQLPDDPELRHETGRRAAHDVIDEHLARWAATTQVDDAVTRLTVAGVPAARVREPQVALDNPQLVARGFAEWVGHPVTGRHLIMGIPFRLASRKDGWISRPAPVLGEHNEEILAGLLNCSVDELAELRAVGVIGERPKGS